MPYQGKTPPPVPGALPEPKPYPCVSLAEHPVRTVTQTGPGFLRYPPPKLPQQPLQQEQPIIQEERRVIEAPPPPPPTDPHNRPPQPLIIAESKAVNPAGAVGPNETPDELLSPYPGFMIAESGHTEPPPPPTLEEIRRYARSCMLDALRIKFRNRDHQRRIAEQFVEWASNKPDGLSINIQAKADDNFWFIGDVHGSLDAIFKIWSWILVTRNNMKNSGEASKQGKHHIILLGDILDRGAESFTIMAFLQLLMMQEDGRNEISLTCIRGNHDAGLRINEDGSFASSVLPSESVGELNAIAEQDYSCALTIATAAIEFARIAPCMGEISNIGGTYHNNSILFTHGGLIHTDLQQELRKHLQQQDNDIPVEKADLFTLIPRTLHAKCSKDFTWVRLVENLPRKLPNRGSSGCEMGTEDINDYRKLHYELTGRAVSFIIRGHDHERPGFKLYSYDETYRPDGKNRRLKTCGLLTINSMEPDESSGGMFRERQATVVHWRKYHSMILYRMPAGELTPQSELRVPITPDLRPEAPTPDTTTEPYPQPEATETQPDQQFETPQVTSYDFEPSLPEQQPCTAAGTAIFPNLCTDEDRKNAPVVPLFTAPARKQD